MSTDNAADPADEQVRKLWLTLLGGVRGGEPCEPQAMLADYLRSATEKGRVEERQRIEEAMKALDAHGVGMVFRDEVLRAIKGE